MLETWLETDPTATWEQLLIVIESPAVSNDQTPDKGNNYCMRWSEIIVYHLSFVLQQ